MFCQTDFSRLLILATEPHWVTLLDKLLAEQPEPVWLCAASSWNDAQRLYRGKLPDLVFATPECLPTASQCPLPPILLLDSAPTQLPADICDWLARDSLNGEVLRRCLHYSQQLLAMQRLAKQDPSPIARAFRRCCTSVCS